MTDGPAVDESLSLAKRALLEIRTLRKRLAQSEAGTREPIAILGMGMRLPGGIASSDEFWNLLAAGGEAITPEPADRWFQRTTGGSGSERTTQYGAFLHDVDQFDAEFFSISPREAEAMDPQHRLLLEVAWEALEDAAIAPATLAGTRTGVFVGASNSDYARQLLADPAHMGVHAGSGGALSLAAGRISYFLNTRGPSLVVDTACSSSLVAVHLACASLRLGESCVALAAGVNLILSSDSTDSLAAAHMLAPDGRCKTFDAAADGYVRGEGCAVIVLKRLSDALAGGDRILAVIRGSAVNQDGRSASITAPNGPAQEAVVREALAAAAVEAAQVDFVETHGTGTALGDPIEVQALGAIYGRDRPTDRPLRIASLKTNIGHLEAAAGIAALI